MDIMGYAVVALPRAASALFSYLGSPGHSSETYRPCSRDIVERLQQQGLQSRGASTPNFRGLQSRGASTPSFRMLSWPLSFAFLVRLSNLEGVNH